MCWCVHCHSGCPHTLRSRSVQVHIIQSAQSVVQGHSGKRVFTQCKILFIFSPCHSWRVYIIRPHMAHMAVVWPKLLPNHYAKKGSGDMVTQLDLLHIYCGSQLLLANYQEWPSSILNRNSSMCQPPFPN